MDESRGYGKCRRAKTEQKTGQRQSKKPGKDIPWNSPCHGRAMGGHCFRIADVLIKIVSKHLEWVCYEYFKDKGELIINV